jgi:hypothetical protein
MAKVPTEYVRWKLWTYGSDTMCMLNGSEAIETSE